MPNNFPILVGSGASTGWQRPSDWLPIPTIAPGEEVVYILMAVYNVVGNFAAFKFQGDYTVDWGDGNIEDVASGVKAEHQYNWADVGDVTSEGFRQALIKITPQAGHNITLVDLQEAHSSVGNGKVSQFIDIVMNIPNVAGTSLEIGNGTIVSHRIVERIWIKQVGVLTTMYQMFYNCNSLQSVPLFDTSSVTTMYQMFYYCYSLQSVPLFDTSSVTNMYQMFTYCYSLQSVPLFDTSFVTNMQLMFYNCHSLQFVPLFDTSSATNMSQMFYNCYLLQSVPLFDTSSATNMFQMFVGCYNLQSVPPFDTSSVINMHQMFLYCYSLQRSQLTGGRVSISYANCQMSATALDEMFTALGTANGAQTITITGNYGAATCDTSIATGKGYTIVN